MEIWKPIKNYEGYYEISSFGRVRSLSRKVWHSGNNSTISVTGKFLTPHKGSNEHVYLKVSLAKNGRMVSKRVHHLVAGAFIPAIKGKSFINHKDGNKFNNSVENLEWVSHKENVAHARVTGLEKNVKLSPSDAEKIKEEYLKGTMNQRELADKYGTSRSLISLIVNGKRWGKEMKAAVRALS